MKVYHMPRWDYWEPAHTRNVVGGIKLQDKGKGQTAWWAKRWTDVLEGFNISSRLQRGRSYARKGQVTKIDIASGNIGATVQGSAARPYKVSIQIQPLSQKQWETVVEKLKEQPIFTAKLLSGEMPQEIEMVFDQAGAPLFPQKQKDLQTSCSCPDYSNPCKHIAAVYYLLGAEFSRDPFLLFKLRGMPREDLLGSLSLLQPVTDEEHNTPEVRKEPITADIQKYWKGDSMPILADDLRKPPVAAALPKQLGSFPLWRGERSFMDTITEVYIEASQAGTKNYYDE